jgi:hypothetical protein
VLGCGSVVLSGQVVGQPAQHSMEGEQWRHECECFLLSAQCDRSCGSCGHDVVMAPVTVVTENDYVGEHFGQAGC